MNGVTTDSVTSSDGSVTIRRRWAKIQPTASPIAIPPAATLANSKLTSNHVPALAPTAASAILYAVSPVPSLISDSPCRIVFARPVAPSRSSTAAAETGSVGPSTAPSTNAAAHGMPEHGVGHGGDRGDRDQHEPDREQRDRRPVRLQLVRGDRDRGRVQQRRQEDEEDDVGVELGRRQARDEPDDQPAEHQRDRVRHAGAQAEAGQHGDGEQQEDEQLDLGHGTICLPNVPRLVDARGLLCPLPLLRARAALARSPPARPWSCSRPTPRRRSTSPRWPPTRAWCSSANRSAPSGGCTLGQL